MSSPNLAENLGRTFSRLERPERYSVLPFRFAEFDETRYIAVNAGGDYILVRRETIQDLIRHKLDSTHPQFEDLEGRQFITTMEPSTAIELLATQYRTRMSRLSDFTALHMFVVTLRCDHSCQYCQVSRVSEDRQSFDMSPETADRAVDLVFQSPSPSIKIEFQGGESLLNFPLIQRIITRAEAANNGRDLQFVIATNLANVSDEIIEFCKDRAVFFSTSLDGPAFIHNVNRRRPGGNSYEKALAGIAKVRESLGPERVSALMTSTAESLKYPEEIVDEYVEQGFESIFLRHISPYGFAAKTLDRLGYETNAFLAFYKKALAHIIRLNQSGRFLVEEYSALMLTRIMTSYPTGYVNLQSPAGNGISAIVYNYNGKVYSADEGRMLAEMGDETFCMGHVSDSYEQLFLESSLLPQLYDSMVETVPMCSDCAFQLYCGTDPVFHHTSQGDFVGHRPTSSFCRHNMGVIKHLIRLLEDDPGAARVLRGWIS